MTLRSHSGGNRHQWRWRLLSGGLAALTLSAALALSSEGIRAAPVDGNTSFARSLRQGEATVVAGTAETETVGSDSGEIRASIAAMWTDAPRMRLRYSRSLGEQDGAEPDEQTAVLTDERPDAPPLRAYTFTVRPGDSLSRLFASEGLAQEDLIAILGLGNKTAVLSRLRPDDRITVYSDESHRVQGLTHERPRGGTLNVARDGQVFRAGVRLAPARAMVVSARAEPPAPESSFDWVEAYKPPPPLRHRSVVVSNGDSLYSIFKSNGFPLGELDAIVKAGDDTRELTRLVPGQRLEFQLTADDSISRLVHYLDETRSLQIKSNGVGYDSRLVDVPLDRHIATTSGTIDASLFVAGQRAGLSNNVIMQLVEIFGWDVDFALDIRKGDSFAVAYEELYKHGKKLKDGNILAATFTNQGKTTRIVRYDYPDGRSAYFTPEGVSIRKAFLRSPVNYTRISSRFSLSRKHPKLHKFRAHRGVDYAAPRGTPIKASGDGKVEFIGFKGGYGKTIVLRHGAVYTTLYAHMSRFARGLRRGQRVSQGQTIGYIGSTGLATGPHLHYEFRVRGVHRNPLSVKLPRAAPIEPEYAEDFRAKSHELVARLDLLTKPTLAADEHRFTGAD